MNKLKCKTRITCALCPDTMMRRTTILVRATGSIEAQQEASDKIRDWRKSLEGQLCPICRSISESVN